MHNVTKLNSSWFQKGVSIQKKNYGGGYQALLKQDCLNLYGPKFTEKRNPNKGITSVVELIAFKNLPNKEN